MHFAVDSYIEALPEKQQKICGRLRILLFENVPNIEEKFSFKIPFYHLYGKMFCYLNKVGNNIEFCLCRGTELQLAFPQVIVGERKLIGGILLTELKDIEQQEIPTILQVAAELQLEYFNTRNKKKQKV